MSGWPRTTPNEVSHPGVWVGSGMDGIDGLDAGDPVTAEQMRALFGHGLHPLADAGAQHFDGRRPSRWTQSRRRCGSAPRSGFVDEATPVPGRGGEADR